MKKYFIIVFLLFTTWTMLSGQATDPLVNSCIASAGPNSKYLKDFRIQLGKSSDPGELRYKTQMSLWKNTRYRFTMCNSDDSPGKLIMSIKDNTNKVVLSSYDQKTGKTYPYVDFICNKSGIYQLNFDFVNGQQGSGVGVVSMIK